MSECPLCSKSIYPLFPSGHRWCADESPEHRELRWSVQAITVSCYGGRDGTVTWFVDIPRYPDRDNTNSPVVFELVSSQDDMGLMEILREIDGETDRDRQADAAARLREWARRQRWAMSPCT